MSDVGPWVGQRLDSPACLHFGAVRVEAAITGERVARWCPSCEGTQYDPSLSLGSTAEKDNSPEHVHAWGGWVPSDGPTQPLCRGCLTCPAVEKQHDSAAMTATVPRVSPRPRGELSDKTRRNLERAAEKRAEAERIYRRAVLDALAESSFSTVAAVTGLSTNTLQRWKAEDS